MIGTRETELTGAEAYGLYRRKMAGRVTSAGGRLVFSGLAKHLVLGQVEELWDEVLVVEFPSKETFVEVIASPEIAEWGVHRRAGLAGQLLIATTAQASSREPTGCELIARLSWRRSACGGGLRVAV